MKKKRFPYLVFLIILSMLISTACSESKQNKNDNTSSKNTTASSDNIDLLMGTGSQGGTYYPLGQEMANVWNKNIKNVNVTSTESGASVENLAKISNGEFDLGMTVNLTAYDAYNGQNDFKGKKVENIAFIGHIYPEVLQVVTRESTGIKSIKDLKGKRIAIGPPGSGTQAAAKLILEAHGIKEGDYEAYQEAFGDAKSKLQDGTIDASFGLLGLPEAGFDELQASVKDVKILSLNPDTLGTIEEKSGYVPYTIKAGTYEWLKEDVQTVSAFAILVANTDTVNDDLAYELAKVMLENADQNTHSQSKHMKKENALNGLGDLPIHPGAEKYYKEIGIR